MNWTSFTMAALLLVPLATLHAIEPIKDRTMNQPTSHLSKAQQAILALPSSPDALDAFHFDAPAGLVFSDEQKQAQREAGASVPAIVLEAFRSGADFARIPARDYRFGKERWGPGGVVYALEFSDLQRDSQHTFTIDATGATFWFDVGEDQAPKAHFCIGFKRCRNVVFKGATIDGGTRGNIEGRITRIDTVNNRLDIQLARGVIVPTGFNGNAEQRLVPFKADGTFCAPLYAIQDGGVHLKYKKIIAVEKGRAWVEMADRTLIATINDPHWAKLYGEQGLLRVGDGLSCIYTTTEALSLQDCANLTMQDIRVHVAKGGSVESGGEGAHLWKDCCFGPRPGTSQWQGGDGFMFNATRHGTTLDHVTVLHTTDDIINVHGYWSLVQSVDGRCVCFTKEHRHRLIPPDLTVGDEAIFLDRATGVLLGKGKIVGIAKDAVVLDTLAEKFANAIVEWPDHECAGWVVQNCQWRDNYQRILIQSGPGVLRGCDITRSGSGLELNCDMPCLEGSRPSGIAIEDNHFTDVNPSSKNGAIGVHLHTFGKRQASLIANLRITGNTFIRSRATAIVLKGVRDVVIDNDRFVEPLVSSRSPDAASFIEVTDGKNVTITGNQVIVPVSR